MDSGDSPDAVSPGTGSTAARSISTVGEGQVCDRCRQKKIKCDGLVPNCTNCVTASAQCIVSAQLRRKTKLRGFKASSLAQAQDLRDENESLRRRLATLEEANSSLTEQIQEVLNQTSPEGNDGHARTGLVAPPPSGLLIKHMGRLVQDSLGVSRFAGSTTGVHFVLSVQQTLRSKMLAMENFPESIFTLHLVPCTSHHLLTRDSTMAMGTATPGLASRFSHPLSYYLKQIRLFSTCWSCICPVVVTGDLSRHLAAALDRAHRGMPPRIEEDNLMFCQIALITLINSITVIPGSPLSISDQDSHNYMTVVNSVLPQLMIRGDLLSLQALVLLSLYIQFTGRHQSMAHINGILVQLGQSLGLQRHTRRFKFSAGENEIRRRIWWWIYLFDKMTAISHGLPKLINDSDLDADYPVDCELEHIDTAQLLFPLPGETTQVRDFIALVHLSRVFSGILDQLYTTTHRREGPAKMAKLSGELRSWNQQFANQLGATINSDGLLISGVTTFKGSQEEPVARIWLPLMSNIALMLIYRPGLTFGEEVAGVEFRPGAACSRRAHPGVPNFSRGPEQQLLAYTRVNNSGNL
ncbi:hypothetical protein GQ53DRAFT_809853 [Thozetella sp. PMI_491]|nr:hypothetical protein GQ53DRAFT_809853 [Thozetella sp. PMI_491]